MKKSVFIITLFLTGMLIAQESPLLLGAHIPPQATSIPAGAKRLLLNKLGQMITAHGASGATSLTRYIMVPNVAILTKDVVPTAPPKISISLEVTLYIGDGFTGQLFSSETFTAKGVGTNETKAYTNAISRIPTRSDLIADFISSAKKEILSYYEAECETIAKKAASLEKQGKFMDALSLVTAIPESSSCHTKQNHRIKSLYQKAIDEDCSKKLNKARALWATEQSLKAAQEAGALLAEIRPEASCFPKVEQLYKEISNRVKEVSDRGWELQLMEVDLTKRTIDTAREIGVAFGENQAQHITYNTKGWF